MKFKAVSIRTFGVTTLCAMLLSPNAKAHELVIDLAAIYGDLGVEFGTANYDTDSDLDNSGVHDVDQANIMQFIAIIADEDQPGFLDVHDTFHDNSEFVETALMPIDTGTISAQAKDHFITLLGMFMTIQGEGGTIAGATETGMRGFVESIWNQYALTPDFDSIDWVQAETFEGGHDEEGEGEGEGEGEPSVGPRPIAYFYEEHDSFSITIPQPVEVSLPIQWYKDGVPMVDDHHVTGATSRTIHVENMHLSHTGSYHAEYETHAKGNKHHVSYGPFAIHVVPVGSLPAVGIGGLALLAGLIAAGAAIRSKR